MSKPAGNPEAEPSPLSEAAIHEIQDIYDIDEFKEELAQAHQNHFLGTRLVLENHHIRVFEIDLLPGERGAFHIHDHTYFWTVTNSGRGLQRFPDGRCVARNYLKGETKYLEQSDTDYLIHDLENVGSTTLSFITAEFRN